VATSPGNKPHFLVANRGACCQPDGWNRLKVAKIEPKNIFQAAKNLFQAAKNLFRHSKNIFQAAKNLFRSSKVYFMPSKTYFTPSKIYFTHKKRRRSAASKIFFSYPTPRARPSRSVRTPLACVLPLRRGRYARLGSVPCTCGSQARRLARPLTPSTVPAPTHA